MMTSMTLQKSRFPVQHIFSTNRGISKSLISQNKTSQRLALAGGVGSGEGGILCLTYDTEPLLSAKYSFLGGYVKGLLWAKRRESAFPSIPTPQNRHKTLSINMIFFSFHVTVHGLEIGLS